MEEAQGEASHVVPPPLRASGDAPFLLLCNAPQQNQLRYFTAPPFVASFARPFDLNHSSFPSKVFYVKLKLTIREILMRKTLLVLMVLLSPICNSTEASQTSVESIMKICESNKEFCEAYFSGFISGVNVTELKLNYNDKDYCNSSTEDKTFIMLKDEFLVALNYLKTEKPKYFEAIKDFPFSMIYIKLLPKLYPKDESCAD
ncbi:hypothetical protein [Paraferrimonas sp. SM1919]|uniref:hypothetical protein n=1 Tax=Paraferrimonas sp. SM1919 TaxID=2662263 RepID=UPI001969FA62|nr:hypothetical protein [Paraferrimonas sp. SM1919]